MNVSVHVANEGEQWHCGIEAGNWICDAWGKTEAEAIALAMLRMAGILWWAPERLEDEVGKPYWVQELLQCGSRGDVTGL